MSHSFIQLPPDSTGKRLHTTSSIDVDGNEVHNQIITLSDPRFVEQQQYVDNEGQAFVRFAEGAPLFDAFGKLKVSQEEHLNNFISFTDNITKRGLVTTSSSASTIVHNANKCSQIITTDANSGSYCRWTSNKRFFYNVGTGMYVLATINLGDNGKENVNRRHGIYDDNNGLYFEVRGTTIGIGKRSDTSGTPVDTFISQANWNVDKLDGTGISKVNIDLTKINIYWIDFQWLGAGRVRFGVIDNSGKRVTCHQLENANSNIDLYMGNAVLPYTFEQFNTDNSVSVSQMYFYNMGIMADGKFEIPYIYKSGTLPSLITIPATATIPIWSIRLQQLYKNKVNHNIVLPSSLTLYSSNCPVLFTIVKNGILTNSTWNFSLGDSVAEGDVTSTSITGGVLVFASIVSPNTSQYIELSEFFNYGMSTEYIKINANGISDVYTLVAKSLGSGCDIYPLMTWKESII